MTTSTQSLKLEAVSCLDLLELSDNCCHRWGSIVFVLVGLLLGNSRTERSCLILLDMRSLGRKSSRP